MFVRGFAFALSLFAIAPSAVCQMTSPGSDVQLTISSAQPNARRSVLETGMISGSVVAIDGTPLRGVEVQLESIRGGGPLAIASTGVNGTFQFSQVPQGDYDVVATEGINQSRERIRCGSGISALTLRISKAGSQSSAGGTVSVKSLQVDDKARNLFQKALDAFHANKLQDAWNHAAKALAVVPNYAQALALRGILRAGKGDRLGGEQDLQDSIRTDSNYPLAYFAMGAMLNDDHRYDDAERTLQQGLKIEPNAWQGYFELSKSALGKSDYRTALRNVVKAESLGSDYAGLHLVKARALLGLQIYDEASTEFERYLQLDPTGTQAPEARKALEAARSLATPEPPVSASQ